MKLLLSQQIQAMRQRVEQLSHGAQGDSHQQELLPKVFDELDRALETLQAVEAELHQQQTQLLLCAAMAGVDVQRPPVMDDRFVPPAGR